MKIPTKVNNDTEGKVSGAGSEITALAESLQAYACATRQHFGKDLVDVSQITKQTIGDADCDRTLEACMKGLDDNWFRSVVLTANLIFSEVPGAAAGSGLRVDTTCGPGQHGPADQEQQSTDGRDRAKPPRGAQRHGVEAA